jgi:hypothetical protein
MINLNAGNLWTDKYLDKVISLNKEHKNDGIRVSSLFGSISRLTPTARSADRIPYLEWSQIDRFVARARNNDIHIRYTLNASCIGSVQDFKEIWERKLKEDIIELHSAGVDEWTITSPLLMMRLKELFPNDFLEVSTIAEVSTPTDAARWLKIGANGVNLGTNINRDFNVIKEIVDTCIEVSILANEACLYRCPFRRECYNLSSHDSLRGEDLFNFYPFRFCNEMRMNDTAEWLRARIVLPQWMKIYQKETAVNWFKIAYRTHPYETAIPILESYMNQYHGGNYLDLWPTISHLGNTEEPKGKQYLSCQRLDEIGFLQSFMKEKTSCNKVLCGEDCVYCDTVVDRLMEEQEQEHEREENHK